MLTLRPLSMIAVLCFLSLVVPERRRVEGILLYALTASSIVPIQHRLQLWLQCTGLLNRVLHNKVLLIVLLRESNLRLLMCFGLLLVEVARWKADTEVRSRGDSMSETSLRT